MDAFDDVPDLVGVQGMGHIIGGARFHRIDRLPDPLRRGHDDDLRGRESLTEQPEGVAAAALPLVDQVEIDEDEFVPPLPEEVDAALDCKGLIHME